MIFGRYWILFQGPQKGQPGGRRSPKSLKLLRSFLDFGEVSGRGVQLFQKLRRSQQEYPPRGASGALGGCSNQPCIAPSGIRSDIQVGLNSELANSLGLMGATFFSQMPRLRPRLRAAVDLIPERERENTKTPKGMGG